MSGLRGDVGPVLVFGWSAPEPVYHLPGWQDPREGQEHYASGEGWETVSAVCGRVTSRYEWKGTERGRHTIQAQWMRWDHARLIGRMCQRCEAIYYG